MIKVNGEIVKVDKFPDGTLLLKEDVKSLNYITAFAKIEWFFENNEELVTLIFLTKHLRTHGVKDIFLFMPYIPNARQDRIKNSEDVFTLKYFTDIINYLNFDKVQVLDPHSSVSAALIDNIEIRSPKNYIETAIFRALDRCHFNWNTLSDELLMFYPDEGAMKRYSDMIPLPYAFGIKKRDWETGQIQGLDVAGSVDKIKDSTILIVDDICSKGGTFYHSAKKLKELGAKEIYLYVTHCENTILEGELLTSGLVEKVYITNSIFTKEHEKIEVIEL